MSDFERMLHAAPKEGSEAQVADLLRQAGARPQPEAEDVVAIKAAARREWRSMVDSRQEPSAGPSSWLALAAGLLVAMGLGWWWLKGTPPAPAMVMEVARAVGTTRAGDEAIGRGAQLLAGSLVETVGPSSSMTLNRSAGGSLRLDASTRVRLIDADGLELQSGAIYFDSGPASGLGTLRVLTPFGTVRDIGTQFEVRIDPSTQGRLRVRVREGAISLEHDGSVHSAREGEELRLREDGGVEIGQVERYGEMWAWAQAASAGLAIDGLPLTDYLEWVGRESGREIRFASPDLAELASGVVLRGTIEGLTPSESLALVLPGSGLAHRVEEHVVIILSGSAAEAR